MGRVGVGLASVVVGVLATLLVDGDADASIDPLVAIYGERPTVEVQMEITTGELAARSVWRSDAEIEPHGGERW